MSASKRGGVSNRQRQWPKRAIALFALIVIVIYGGSSTMPLPRCRKLSLRTRCRCFFHESLAFIRFIPDNVITPVICERMEANGNIIIKGICV